MYSLCFLVDIALSGWTARYSPFSTSLHRHYPTSMVLFARPTTRFPFALLLSLLGIPLSRIYIKEISGFSPVDVMSLYSMADLRPRGANYWLANIRQQLCCLPFSKERRHTRRLISGLKCLMTLLPNFLRLTLCVTTASPRFAIGGMALPYRAGFPPAKHYTLSWAHLLFTA